VETLEVGVGYPPSATDNAFLTERAALISLCARLTGNPDVAEDLAQETLLLGHQQAEHLRDQSRRLQWLRGIARNLCLHWRRRRKLELARLSQPRSDNAEGQCDAATNLLDTLADDLDVEAELERAELVTLLDRALSRLPTETRQVLVARFVHEIPRGEIARRFGLSDRAVAMRLQRGKSRLRQLLMTDLRQDAIACGIVGPEATEWQETRLWCFVCGRRHLLGRFTPDRELWLDCVDCLGLPRSVMVRAGSTSLFHGVKGFRPSLNRLLIQGHATLQHGIAGRTVRCRVCNAVAPLQTTDAWRGCHHIEAICPRCGTENACTSFGFLALSTPEGRRFFREHPRIRSLPDREIEVDGRPAAVTSFASVGDSALLEVVVARDTAQVLGIHRA
jgi:RNA polymerase sigma factor (sigma-70 family)